MNDIYESLSNRNLGLLSKEEQEKLRKSCVVICGTGGLGGPIAEILARLGVGHMKLIDWGTFEPTNLNRQNFCFTDTCEKKKTEVTKIFLEKINPDIKVEIFDELSEENVDDILDGATIANLCIDHLHPILILSRKCREKNIPLVEGWAIVYGNVRVFTKDTPSLEEVYDLPTTQMKISDISEGDAKDLLFQSMNSLASIEGLFESYPQGAMERLYTKGEGTTLAPFVWLTCCLMSIENMKIIVGWNNVALAPNFSLYDPLSHRIPKQE